MDPEITSSQEADRAKLLVEQIDAEWDSKASGRESVSSVDKAGQFIDRQASDAITKVRKYVDEIHDPGLAALAQAVEDRIRIRVERARSDAASVDSKNLHQETGVVVNGVAAAVQGETVSKPAKEPASVDVEESQQVEKQIRAEAQERLTSVMQEFERARQGGDAERIDLCYGNAMKAYDHLIDAYASAKALDVNERLDLGAMRCDKQIVHHEYQASLLKAEMDAATDPETRKEKEAAWMKERDAQKNFMIAKDSILQRKNKKVEEGASGPVSGKVIDPMEPFISLIMAMHDPGEWVGKIAGGFAAGKSEQSH